MADQRNEKVISRGPLSESGISHTPAIEDMNMLNQETIDKSCDMERKIRSYTATGSSEKNTGCL